MTLLLLFISIILIVADQLVKRWAVNTLQGAADIPIIQDVFHFAYVENRGAAFGMFQDRQWFFIIITIIVLGGILFYWPRIPHTKLGTFYKISLTLIISGAIGNLIDRVFLGYVVDMFYFILIDFPVFNIADVCVVTGTIFLAGGLMLEDFFAAHKNKIEKG
ncbi:signal peptidase II [Candidatus Epulonipiscium viviparus]|uniref:signal peptidase II n=1 Tax=Candidatus Epulonipiscium viviparus TaxID=420336 RepID=UPI00016C089D|nr:signal peptidase II [Candidatus Epulopiscium viviparus]